MSGEAPDIREREDCPGADVCGSTCDQHPMSEHETGAGSEQAGLSSTERRSLGCQCARVEGVWHHGRGCPVPTVERILADRADRIAPTTEEQR